MMNTKQIIKKILTEQKTILPTKEEFNRVAKGLFPTISPEQAHGSCFVLRDGTIVGSGYHFYAAVKVIDQLEISPKEIGDMEAASSEFIRNFVTKSGIIRLTMYSGSVLSTVGLHLPEKITFEQLNTLKYVDEGYDEFDWVTPNRYLGHSYQELIDYIEEENLLESKC